MITSNILNSYVCSHIALPTELCCNDVFRYKTWSQNSFSVISTFLFQSFLLADESNSVVEIRPNKGTELYGVRIERSHENSLISDAIGYINAFRDPDNKLTGEALKYIIYEGDIVVLGGFLKYNLDSDSLYIDDVDVITTGGQQNLLQYFKDWKIFYSSAFKIGVIITGVLA
jgi:hypothetical protein